MKQFLKNITETEERYRIRWMACVALAEALTLLIVLFWPVPARENLQQDITFSDNEISLEEVVITRQPSTPPSPPKPQVPVPVPDDEIIEEEILVMEDINLSDFTDSLSVEGVGRESGSDRISANPQSPPSVVRIVEPTVPNSAKQERVKAEIWVNFLVDTEGRVEEATIDQILLYDKSEDEFRQVQSIGYGLVEATLEAALQWKFRPAKDEDSPVRAYTRHIFTFGF